MEFLSGIAFLAMILTWGYGCNWLIDLAWKAVLRGHEKMRTKS